MGKGTSAYAMPHPVDVALSPCKEGNAVGIQVEGNQAQLAGIAQGCYFPPLRVEEDGYPDEVA